MNKPIVFYQPEKPARFGVFPRRHPELVRWFETDGCCILHTANTWDEYNSTGDISAVNMLACRLTTASLVFSAGNIEPPPNPSKKQASRPMSFFAKYDDEEHVQDPEKSHSDEMSPLLGVHNEPESSKAPHNVPISHDDEEQCRLYYYRFSLAPGSSNTITHEFALAAIPFEFPTISPFTEMSRARYIYGCSTSDESFGAALGKATKIDILVRVDVQTLLNRAQKSPPQAVDGCVDTRTIDEILASDDRDDPIKAFHLPPNHFGQEARFVPRSANSASGDEAGFVEEDGYLLFYVFNEDQLDEDGECKADAESELWVLDARDMQTVVCKIQLGARIPYGLHGNWFREEDIAQQREIASVRSVSETQSEAGSSNLRKALVSCLG